MPLSHTTVCLASVFSIAGLSYLMHYTAPGWWKMWCDQPVLLMMLTAIPSYLSPFCVPLLPSPPPSLYLPMDSILSLTPALHKSPLSTEETMVCALCLTVVNLLVHCFSSQFALQFAPMHWGVDLTSTARACPDWSLPGSLSDWLSKV